MGKTAGITIQFRNGRTLAVLCISAEAANASLTAERCIAYIESAGLQVDPTIEAEVQAAVSYARRHSNSPCEHVLARGRAPEHGQDGRFEWLPEFDPEQRTTGGADEHGSSEDRVDYYSVSVFRMACDGDHLATVHPPTAGRDGATFDGTTLPARNGTPYKLRHDDSVELRDDGSVIARRNGVISISSGKLRVLDVLDIPGNVDFHTGNIEFSGSVTIRKDICDCFTVKCTDDLSVTGLIQAANIQTGGDATFSRGMAGREKGAIDIHGSLHARYLEGVLGSVDLDLNVEREVVNCTLIVGRNLNLESGALINSCVRVGGMARVGTVGSPANVRTTIAVGDFPELDADLQHIRRLIPEVIHRLDVLRERRQAVLEYTALQMVEHDERLLKLDTRIEMIVPRLRALQNREQQILQVFAQHSACEMHVLRELFSGSIVILRDVAARVTCDLRGPLCVQFDNHGEPVVIDQQSQKRMPLSSISETIDRYGAYEGYIEAEAA